MDERDYLPQFMAAARNVSAECALCRSVFVRPMGRTAQRDCPKCAERNAKPSPPQPKVASRVGATIQRSCGALSRLCFTLHRTEIDWSAWDSAYARSFGVGHDPHMAELVALFAAETHRGHYGSFELQVVLDRLAQAASYDGSSHYALGTMKESVVSTLRQANEYLRRSETLRAVEVCEARWWRTACKAAILGWRFVVADGRGNLGLIYHSIAREIVVQLGDLLEPLPAPAPPGAARRGASATPGLINLPPL